MESLSGVLSSQFLSVFVFVRLRLLVCAYACNYVVYTLLHHRSMVIALQLGSLRVHGHPSGEHTVHTRCWRVQVGDLNCVVTVRRYIRDTDFSLVHEMCMTNSLQQVSCFVHDWRAVN